MDAIPGISYQKADMSYIRSIKQGEDLYEVILDGGSKKTGLTLNEAVRLVEEHMHQNTQHPQTEEPSGNGDRTVPDLDAGS